MTFKPGQSGNPKGRVKTDRGIAELARMKGKRGIEILSAIMDDEKVPPSVRITAIGMLHDRGYGKPPQFTTDDVGAFRKATEMSDAELDDAIARVEARLRAAEGKEKPPADTNVFH